MDTNVPLTRHQAKCSICRHAQREEIEDAFVSWAGPDKIARDFRVPRDSIYRHAAATGLALKRQQNVRAALERIIEHAGDVQVNAYAVVQAISAYSRINTRGQWVQRPEIVNVNELFNRMSANELEKYAQSGELPEWFPAAVDASGERNGEEETEGNDDQDEIQSRSKGKQNVS